MKNSSVKILIKKKIALLQKKLQGECFLLEEYYDIYYLTHLKMSKATLIVGKEIALFVDAKYEEIAKKQCPFSVHSIESLNTWIKEHKLDVLYFDAAKTSYERYLNLKKVIKGLKPAENPLKEIRMIKLPQEIEAIEKSTNLLMKGMLYIKSCLKEGITEKQIARAFEIYCLQEGAEKLSFEPIIAFGANSAMPHYRAGDGILKKNTIVLIDIGVVVENYASDMTRVIFFGKVDPRLAAIDDLVKKTYTEVVKHVKAGVSIQKLDEIARDFIKSHGGYPILHGLGHSIGLEVHEYPSLNIRIPKEVKLKKNMVVTIEPGIYIPDLGGARHEDMILIQENGFKNFYKNLYSDTFRI